jgi:hypothetical protein
MVFNIDSEKKYMYLKTDTCAIMQPIYMSILDALMHRGVKGIKCILDQGHYISKFK